MFHKIIFLTGLFAVLMFGASAQVDSLKRIQPAADSAKKGCTDAACHGSLLKAEVVHHPVQKGDCDKCHKSNGAQHPLAGGKTFTLVKDVPSLCYKCHDENNVMKAVHSPVQKGECLQCHNPHNSPESNLLKINPTAKLCEKCHTLESAKKAFKHEAVVKGECVKCHDPHQSDLNRLLQKESPALCLKCHKKQEEEMNMANVHPPFQNNCLNCHAQHSSSENKLLNMTPKNLCLNCHDDMEKRIQTAAVVHGALNDKRSCINCHSPHASGQKRFLVNDVNHMCLSCHDKGIAAGTTHIKNIGLAIQKGKSVHQAVYKVSCIGCHDPHTSSEPYLLKKSFPAGTYTKVSKESFALCFECHKNEMLEKSNASLTSFRNGDVNLHYIHVNGEKGRSCVVCHDPHGAPNEKLINDIAPFGSWEMPLKFKKVDNGGSCAPGCHAERKYERAAVIQK